MQKKIRKIVSSILASCMVITAFTGIAPQKAEAKTTLVNVAVDGTASTQSGENGNYVIGNINDGDPKTSWQTPGTWPSTAVIQLDRGRSVSKVAVELGEDGDNSTGRTALVTVQYAQNGITGDLIDFGSKRMTVDSKEEFIADVPKSATHIYVTLSDPQNSDGSQGAFWPSVQEVEVFEEQEEKVSDYNNIANQAKITTDGNEHPTDGSAKLVDGNDTTLYKFHNAAQTEEKYIALNFDEARTMMRSVLLLSMWGIRTALISHSNTVSWRRKLVTATIRRLRITQRRIVQIIMRRFISLMRRSIQK